MTTTFTGLRSGRSETLFADTFYWVGLFNQRDQYHQVVVQATRALRGVLIVTTQEVLVETLGELGDEGPYIRKAAAAYVRETMDLRSTQVVPQTPETFETGLALYEKRLDKAYSLVDCISMATMKAQGLRKVLTPDRHFEQEGYERLFRPR